MPKEIKVNNQNPDLNAIVSLFEKTQSTMFKRASRAVNNSLVVRNWLFGLYISEFEKQSSVRSEVYGKKLMQKLSERLTLTIGKGFSRRSLDLFLQFYDQYKKIRQTLSAESFITLEKQLDKA